MRDEPNLLNISTLLAFADGLRRLVADVLYGLVLVGLTATAIGNNILAWTNDFKRASILFGDHTSYWPLLHPAIGVIACFVFVTAYAVAVLFDVRKRLWPVFLLSASTFIPFLILPVLALLAWDVQRRARRSHRSV